MAAKTSFFSSRFYLTGGTALAGFYYNHRESLDLDLFSLKEFSYKDVLEALFRTQKQLRYTKIHRIPDQGQGRIVLTFSGGSTLNLDFVYYPFPKIKPDLNWNNLKVDSLPDIATNKLNTMLVRKTTRDYIDLYTLMNREKYTLKLLRKHMIKKFDWKVGPLQLSQHFLQVNELDEMPKMKIPFSRKKMVRFYEQLAKSLEPEIFK